MAARIPRARSLPGVAALNTGQAAQVNSIACPSADHCAAVGDYAKNAVAERPFVVSQS